MNKLVPELFGTQSIRISKPAEKNSSHLKNSASLGEQQVKGLLLQQQLCVECICEANAWRNAKWTMLVSEARHSDTSKL